MKRRHKQKAPDILDTLHIISEATDQLAVWDGERFFTVPDSEIEWHECIPGYPIPLRLGVGCPDCGYVRNF